MSLPAADPSVALKLLRFGVRALRISVSTLAVVALLRQQWLAGAACSLAWLLILAAPLRFPQLEQASIPGTVPQPPRPDS